MGLGTIGKENYEQKRAMLRSAQQQDEDMRSVMKDCAQQLGRAQAAHAKEQQALNAKVEECCRRLEVAQLELGKERAQAAQAVNVLKKRHLEQLSSAEKRHAAEVLRRELEARIVAAELRRAEERADAHSAAHERELGAQREAHEAALGMAREQTRLRLKERSATHKARLDAVLASERMAQELVSAHQEQAAKLDAKLRVARDEQRDTAAQLAAELARVAILASELHALEGSSAFAASEREQLLRCAVVRASELEQELSRRSAAHAHEAARQASAHAQQLSLVEERVRALVTRRDAEVLELNERLVHALGEAELTKRALAEVID